MTSYDSKAEAAASDGFRRLGCISAHSHFYPHTFIDADGAEFRAKPDFFHPASGLYIEFKAGPLNTKRTKATADKAIARQEAWKGVLSPWDWLQCGWCVFR